MKRLKANRCLRQYSWPCMGAGFCLSSLRRWQRCILWRSKNRTSPNLVMGVAEACPYPELCLHWQHFLCLIHSPPSLEKRRRVTITATIQRSSVYGNQHDLRNTLIPPLKKSHCSLFERILRLSYEVFNGHGLAESNVFDSSTVILTCLHLFGCAKVPRVSSNSMPRLISRSKFCFDNSRWIVSSYS